MLFEIKKKLEKETRETMHLYVIIIWGLFSRFCEFQKKSKES